MRVREHNGFGHGLRPGTDHDMGCGSCKRERAAGITPVITGQDDDGDMPGVIEGPREAIARKQGPRKCFFIPVEQFDENGYTPSLVTEGQPVRAPLTGNGPLATPWYWGKTYDEAKATAVRENARLGISEADAAAILLSSLAGRVPSPPRRKFPAMVKVQITNAHGTFTTDTLALDLMIQSRLPASPMELRDRLAETTGLPVYTYDDISTVTEFLVMMADADYPWKGTS